jgi:hypothetical protein
MSCRKRPRSWVLTQTKVGAMDGRRELRRLIVWGSRSGTRVVDQEFRYWVTGVSMDVVK